MMNFNDYKKQVGLTVKQMFTPKISDRYGATRVSSAKHRTGTTHIALHTTANTAPARNEALNIKNNAGINSFHAVVDKDEVYETVRFQNVAHHAGHKGHNCSSLGFELVQKDMEAGYKNLVKYVGYVMAQLNLKPSHKTIQYHHDIVRTSCGGFYKEKGKDNVLKDITYYYNIAKGESTKKAPKPQAKPKPSKPKNKKVTKKVVNDVILGKYGNGADRKKNLEKAGYNYKEVQDAVNRSYGAKPKPKPKPKTKPKPKPQSNKVTVKKTATHFSTGQKMDNWVKGSTFDVIQKGKTTTLIGRGNSVIGWVKDSDLVGNTSKPKSKIGRYANFKGNVRLFKKSRGDACYHATRNGQNNVYTNVRATSAKILDEDNGRVLVSVPRFNPNKVWIANSESTVSDKPKYNL